MIFDSEYLQLQTKASKNKMIKIRYNKGYFICVTIHRDAFIHDFFYSLLLLFNTSFTNIHYTEFIQTVLIYMSCMEGSDGCMYIVYSVFV